MLISRLFLSEDPPILSEEDYEDSPEHQELKERLRKTLYYGRNPKSDRPSLAVTEIAVELLQEAAPRQLGRVDEFVASSLSHKASVSPCALMIGLIYIERLKHRNPEYLQQISSSDLFLISMMVASKYLYDEGVEEEVFNDEWSDAANMEVSELNELERNFLSAVDWNLFVKETDFRKVLTNIERRVAVRKGRERGFYSYCDLMVLSENEELRLLVREIMLQLCKVVLVCSVAYVASVLTLLGSSVSLGYIRHHTHTVPRILVPPALINRVSVDGQLGLEVSPFIGDVLSNLHESHSNTQPSVNLSDETGTEDVGANLGNESDRTLNSGNGLGKDLRYKQVPAEETTRPQNVSPGIHDVGLDHRPQVTFPNLLMLSVIRDTLVQFLLAVQDQKMEYVQRTKENKHKVLQKWSDGSYVCSWGCCQGEVHSRCQNSTQQIGLNSVEHCWRTVNYANQETDQLPCNVQQCCCPSALNLGLWDTFDSEVNDPLTEVRKGFQTMRLVDAVS